MTVRNRSGFRRVELNDSMPPGVTHILVVDDGTAASRRALADAAAIADEHRAEISVVALVPEERHTVGCCGVGAPRWNRMLREVADAELLEASLILGDRDPRPRFEIVSGTGSEAVLGAVERLGCDLVLVPAHGPLRGRLARRVRRGLDARAVAVRAA